MSRYTESELRRLDSRVARLHASMVDALKVLEGEESGGPERAVLILRAGLDNEVGVPMRSI